MKSSLSDMFVLPNLALVEAGSGPAASEDGAVSSLNPRNQARFQAEGPEAHQEVIRADALNADGTHCLVIGGAGSGKTTLLRYLAFDKARNSDYFPIFLPLRSLQDSEGEHWESLISLAFRASVARMRRFTPEEVEALVSHVAGAAGRGRIALFLDGLDEMDAPGRDRLCRLVEDFLSSSMAHNSVVLSTRPDAGLGARLKSLRRYEILPLNLEQTRSLLEKHMPDPITAAELMIRFVTVPSLQALSKNPLMVVLLAKAAAQAGDALPRDNTLFWYESAVKSTLGETPHRSDALRLLEVLAYETLVEGEPPRSSRRQGFAAWQAEEFAKGWIEDERQAASVAETILKSSAVTRVGEDSFEFVHLSLKEYLAARAVARSQGALKLILRMVFDPALSEGEVAPMAVGMLENPERAYRLLEAVPDSVDLSIFRVQARALRYVNQLWGHYAERLADELAELIVDEESCLPNTLAGVASNFAGSLSWLASAVIQRVATLLQHPAAGVRRRAALTLGAISSTYATEALSGALRDGEREVREEAAKALGNIGDPESVHALHHAYLHDEGRTVFKEAVDALVKIGGQRAVSALLTILNDTDIFVNLRWPVARALGKIGDPSSFDALVGALADKYESVRENAALALGALGDLRAAPALRALLSDAVADVRAAAAEALGRLRDPEATALLLAALSDTDPRVRYSAAEALMPIDAPGLTRALSEVVRDRNNAWRGTAATLLARVAGREALPLLLALTKERDSAVRESATHGLMSITDQEASAGLLSLLDDPSADVRWNAAYGLGSRRYESALDALIGRLESEELDWVRSGVAHALGRIGDKRAVGPLIRMLDKGGAASSYSALALGRIGDVAAVPALTAICKQGREKEYLRGWPIRALARIGGPAAAQSLIELLQTGDVEGRRLIVGALPEVDDTASVHGLLMGVTDEDNLVRVYAREGLRILPREILEAGLRQGLNHPDARVRSEAAGLIPFYADDGVYRQLQNIALNDVDPQVMLAAAQAVAASRRKLESLFGLIDW